MQSFKFYFFGHQQIKENCSGIYAIVNTLNNKKYVGSSGNLRKRYRQHFNELSKNKHINIHLQRAFNKYGKDAFEFWILEECENIRDTLLTIEQKWIDSDGDYNICKLASHPYGEVYSGHEITEEHKERIRDSNRNRVWSKESLQKKSEYMKNSDVVAKLRKIVLQCDLKGNIIKEYSSIMDAAKAMGSVNKRVQIKRCCQGKCKTAYKYKWFFKNGNKTVFNQKIDS